MTDPAVHRLSAFTTDPQGGNPAGVVLAEEELDAAWMQATAKEVGYSETAFLWPSHQERRWTIRYFSPEAEVPFCGHATIATGVLLAGRHGAGRHVLDTRAGEVGLDVDDADGGRAALTSVDPDVPDLPDDLLRRALDAFGWQERHLSAELRPALAFAGARHLLLPVRSRVVLAEMSYDFEALLAAMHDHDILTVAALWQQSPTLWHARNAFPTGGVIEDPATGAAAAAFGGWARAVGLVEPPTSLTIHQGDDMGRPSRLDVEIPPTGGIVVSGRAVPL